MLRLIAFLFFLVCSTLCFSEIYRWVDADGRVYYSDQPPPSTVKEEKTIKTTPRARSSSSSNSSAKTLEQQDLDFRQRRAKAEEEKVKQEKEAAEEKDRKENCERAKGRLANLQAGGPAIKYNDQGAQVYLNDQEIKQEIATTQKAVESWCTPRQAKTDQP
jgi:Domain of unknown function (DUF4124)